ATSDHGTGVVLPADYTFTAADAGQRVFSAALVTTSATQTITATDTLTSSLTGTTQSITILPSAFTTDLATSGNPASGTLSGAGGANIQVTVYGAPFTTPEYVSLQLVGAPGTLGGTLSAPADLATGIATFTDVHISGGSSSASYALQAWADNQLVASGHAFTLTGGGNTSAATSGLFSVQPATSGNSTGAQAPAPLTGASGANITVTLAGAPFD